MDNGASSYRRYLDGDEAAFDDILKAYRDNLTFFINRFVHDLDAAEDLAIDTFMYLIVHRYRYNFRTPLKTYLFMIGRSRALDYIKHRKKLTMVELSEAEHEIPQGPTLEEIILLDERKQILNRALNQLPADMQTAVHLVYFEDLTYEDAAKVMKKNKKQVANLLYRAKEKLRAILGKDGVLY
ncbi:MAG: RNA polymerase sigma factor [Oscillospiraceae bacterium]|nr:RNA polymerase sigma factor [Oscillospiraceae bacterium]